MTNSMMYSYILVIQSHYKHSSIVTAMKDYLMQQFNYDSTDCDINSDVHVKDCACDLFKDVGLLDSDLTTRANSYHWLHLKSHSESEIPSGPLYKILETLGPGSVLADVNGHYWICRATACVTRHRFINVSTKVHSRWEGSRKSIISCNVIITALLRVATHFTWCAILCWLNGWSYCRYLYGLKKGATSHLGTATGFTREVEVIDYHLNQSI